MGQVTLAMECIVALVQLLKFLKGIDKKICLESEVGAVLSLVWEFYLPNFYILWACFMR